MPCKSVANPLFMRKGELLNGVKFLHKKGRGMTKGMIRYDGQEIKTGENPKLK